MSANEHVMLHGNQQRTYSYIIITVGVITILMLGFSSYSSSSSISALPFQSAIHHHKISDKKVGRVSTLVVAVDHTLKGQITSMKVIAKIIIKITTKTHMIVAIEVQDCRASAPTPGTTCEQGSNCTDQQSLSDRKRSTNASGPTEQEDTPFVLSLPFP